MISKPQNKVLVHFVSETKSVVPSFTVLNVFVEDLEKSDESSSFFLIFNIIILFFHYTF